MAALLLPNSDFIYLLFTRPLDVAAIKRNLLAWRLFALDAFRDRKVVRRVLDRRVGLAGIGNSVLEGEEREERRRKPRGEQQWKKDQGASLSRINLKKTH